MFSCPAEGEEVTGPDPTELRPDSQTGSDFLLGRRQAGAPLRKRHERVLTAALSEVACPSPSARLARDERRGHVFAKAGPTT